MELFGGQLSIAYLVRLGFRSRWPARPSHVLQWSSRSCRRTWMTRCWTCGGWPTARSATATAAAAAPSASDRPTPPPSAWSDGERPARHSAGRRWRCCGPGRRGGGLPCTVQGVVESETWCMAVLGGRVLAELAVQSDVFWSVVRGNDNYLAAKWQVQPFMLLSMPAINVFHYPSRAVQWF